LIAGNARSLDRYGRTANLIIILG